MNTATRRPSRRGQQTRERLLAVAETLFVDVGYQGVSIERIVQRAGVTKGAFYHHFNDKLSAFLAVFERIDREMSERVMDAALLGTTPLDMIRRGMRCNFELCIEPRYGRLVYLEGPAALGWREWHHIDSRLAGAIINTGLQAAVESGELRTPSLPALSTLLLGAILQANITIAEADDPAAACAEMATEADHLLQSLHHFSFSETTS
jgi:AcrR family transcriptional regulator